jgi:hypothetical protein
MDPLSCIHAYITYKSSQKAPDHQPEVDPFDEDLMECEERQLKIDDKRETVLMKKAKRMLFEKSFGPIELIIDTLQQVGSKLGSRHEGLIPKMKLAWHDMPPEAVEVLEIELTATVNECTDILPDLTEYFKGDPESCPNWLIGDETESGDNGE